MTWWRHIGSGTARIAALSAAVVSLLAPVAAAAQDAGVVVEEIEPSTLDLLRADFEAAMEVFSSVRQAESIPLLSAVIDGLTGADRPLDTEQNTLLTSALFRRAEARLNLGENEAAAQDLEAAVRVDLGYQPASETISPKLLDLFEQARSRVAGYLEARLDPADSEVISEGRRLQIVPGEPSPILAGNYQVTVQRPGYASQDFELEVEPGVTVPLEVQLDRVSAVVRVRTVEPGVEVVVDGVRRGVTERHEQPMPESAGEVLVEPGGTDSRQAENETLPAELIVDGLTVGSHALELHKEGFRSGTTDLEVESLTDYEMDLIALEETRGELLVVDMPAEATLSVNGELLFPAGTVKGEVNFPLPVGDHFLEVDAGNLGGFEHHFSLEDRAQHSVDVRLKPRLTLLGVYGGDVEVADRLRREIAANFSNHADWLLLDRSGEAGPSLRDVLGSDLGEIRAGNAGSIEWSQVQALAGQRAPGSVYVLALLSDDLLASDVDLVMLPAAPATALVDVRRVELSQPDSLADWAGGFGPAPSWSSPRLGAQLLDSRHAQGPVVAAIDALGPAATAGLEVGDVILSLGDSPTATSRLLLELLNLVEAGATVPMQLLRDGDEVTVELSAVVSDRIVVDPDDDRPGAVTSAWLNLAEARGALADWLLALNRAGVYRTYRAWPEVVLALRSAGGPSEAGLGRAAVDYWLGVALLEADPVGYRDQASEAFTRAAGIAGARLGSDDGPLVEPRAAARLGQLQGP